MRMAPGDTGGPVSPVLPRASAAASIGIAGASIAGHERDTEGCIAVHAGA